MAGPADQHGIMIDSVDTVDRDDAIWVRATDDGFEFWVHIALVANEVALDSPTDNEARRRLYTRYRRNFTKHMLPKPVEANASLHPNDDTSAPQPSFVVHCHTDPTGNVHDVQLGTGQLQHAWAISYQEAANGANDPHHPRHDTLAVASQLAQRMLQSRRTSGALAIYDLQHGYATNEEGQLVRLDKATSNSGYVIVQELMIAANTAIATWAAQHDIPILFRNHRLAAVAGDHRDLQAQLLEAEAANDSQAWELVRNRMRMVARAATYDATVSGHHGLQLPVYAHNTSPIRRFADLVNQRILLAATQGNASPYSPTDLHDIAEDINLRISEERARRTEHFRREAQRTTARNLADGDFSQLSEVDFAKVVRAAAESTTAAPELITEITQRIRKGQLQLRELGAIYFSATDPAWQEARQLISQQLATDPGRAISLVNMYAQSVLGGPLDSSHVKWEVQGVGDIHQPRFEARLTLNVGDEHHVGPRRIERSKKEARNQAAFALARQLAGVSKETVDPGPDSRSLTSNAAAMEPLDATLHPIQALTIYEQREHITDMTWEFSVEGPAHERLFTCTVSATINGEILEATGIATTKKAAKTAAAANLRSQVDHTLI